MSALALDGSLENIWNSLARDQNPNLSWLNVILDKTTQARLQTKKSPKTMARTDGIDAHHWRFLLGPTLTSFLVSSRGQLLHDEFSEYFYDTENHALLEKGMWLRLRRYWVKQGKALRPNERSEHWTLKQILREGRDPHEVCYRQYKDEATICAILTKTLDLKPLPFATPMTYCDTSLCGFTTHRYRDCENASWFVDCALIPVPDDARDDPSLDFEDKCFVCLTKESLQSPGTNVSPAGYRTRWNTNVNVIEHFENDLPSPSKAIVSLGIKGIVPKNGISRKAAMALCLRKNPFGDTYTEDKDGSTC
jgi:hypothetical protein